VKTSSTLTAGAARIREHQPDQDAVTQPYDNPASMLSSSARASAGSTTDVCPAVTTCPGPRTNADGLTGTTWPVTAKSNTWRNRDEPMVDPQRREPLAPATIQVATCTGWT
jgi:hypothetical protein